GVPATIEFEKSNAYELIGETTEIGKLIDAYSELFMQQEKFYENKVSFKQKVKVTSGEAVKVKFSSETQVCDAEKCLAPDWLEHSVTLTPKKTEKPEEPQKENQEVELVKTETEQEP